MKTFKAIAEEFIEHIHNDDSDLVFKQYSIMLINKARVFADDIDGV
jgi:hypothetical protein